MLLNMLPREIVQHLIFLEYTRLSYYGIAVNALFHLVWCINMLTSLTAGNFLLASFDNCRRSDCRLSSSFLSVAFIADRLPILRFCAQKKFAFVHPTIPYTRRVNLYPVISYSLLCLTPFARIRPNSNSNQLITLQTLLSDYYTDLWGPICTKAVAAPCFRWDFWSLRPRRIHFNATHLR